MRPASEAFRRTVRSSHTMTARARAVPPGQTGTDPDGLELEVLDGDVHLDAKAAIRGTLDLAVPGRHFPLTSSDPLAPYGQEVFVERGVRFGNGSTEWVSLGYFRVSTDEQTAAPIGQLRITGGDRMAGLVSARMLAPVQFAASATYGDVFAQLVTEVYPGAVIEWDDDTDTRTLGYAAVVEKDRRRFLANLADAAGKIAYWDHNGHLAVKSRPDTGAPVEQLDAGAGGVLVQLDRRLSREGTYNAVVAVGEPPDGTTPVRGVAIDNDPASPTYFYGTFGQVPRYLWSQFLTTTDQAEHAARELLRGELGLPYSVNLSSVPNPALEPLDPVAVTYPMRPRSAQMRRESHLLESLTIPLAPGRALTATTREQSHADIGVIPT